jgi:hypothetical protein
MESSRGLKTLFGHNTGAEVFGHNIGQRESIIV